MEDKEEVRRKAGCCYACSVTVGDEPVVRQVAGLKAMLESELDERARRFRGCWPLLVALGGLLLAAALLWPR